MIIIRIMLENPKQAAKIQEVLQDAQKEYTIDFPFHLDRSPVIGYEYAMEVMNEPID